MSHGRRYRTSFVALLIAVTLSVLPAVTAIAGGDAIPFPK